MSLIYIFVDSTLSARSLQAGSGGIMLPVIKIEFFTHIKKGDIRYVVVVIMFLWDTYV